MWVPAMLSRARATIELSPWSSASARPGLHRPEPLVWPAVDADEGTLRDQDVGHVGDVVEPLRASESAIRERRCPDPVLLEPVRARQLVLDQDEAGVVTEVLERGERRFEEGDRVGSPPSIDHGSPAEADRSRLPLALAQVVPDRSRLGETRLSYLRVTGSIGRQPGPLEQVRPIRWVARDLERFEEEDAGLVMAAESRRAIGGTTQGEPCLCRESLALGVIARRAIRRQVVRGERTGQLVLAQALEEARGRQVPAPPVALGQRPVRHLADE